MADVKVIVVRGDFERYEATSAGVIKPGMLVELTSAGKVQACTAAGANCERAFADGDFLQGKQVSESYADAALVQYNVVKSGGIVQAVAKASNAIAVGDKVYSNGDGTVRKTSAATGAVNDDVVGVAVEAQNATTNFVKIRIK